MAEQVARLKILAQIEGLEGFDKLKGAFKGLQQAIGPSDQQLSKARREILAFGEAGAKTEQTIRGQIEALKALQGQASVSGALYKQLGKDIRDLGGAYKEASTGVKQFTDAQLASQIVGSKPSTFDKQIAALRRGLQELKVYSQEYTNALTEIQRRQLPFNTAVARQGVIAAANTYAQGGKGGAALPELPDTTAALNQRLSELTQEFANITRGGERWIQVSREIASVQRQLNREFANPAVEAARRRLEASRNTTSGFLAFSQSASTIGDRIAVEKSIARNQRKQSPAAIELPMMETSELYRSIQAIGLSRIAQQNELMGNSYKQVAQDIRGATAASDGSVNSLRAQRSAWESLRNAVNTSSAEFKEASRELVKLDQQLERTQGGGSKIGQRVQAFGAIASGAIFGGPEGLIGGIGGAALGSVVPGLGTVGGAFAGAAIGGSVSMLRQQIAGTAEYAATVGRLNIALKELTATQEDYNEAQRIIRSVTTELNVPTLEATQGFTKLLASVKGAGGNVRDAEIVFRGVTEAIKATGGTAEDVQGALTAMSQVFSKGKVSAEELSGQLGERLPGAFTRFAAATGRTGAQLSEALKEGTVGLNDVMKFSMALSEQNSATAIKMAKSQEDSTARMRVALTNLQAAFGQAVMPITTAVLSIIASIAELATRTLKALGLVKDALNEMGAAGRDADLNQRLRDANQPLGLQSFGPFRREGGYSAAEVTEFRRRALALEKAITPQNNKAGLEQNLRYLQEVQEILRKVPANSLSEKQIDAFEKDQKRIQGRINETREAIERLKSTQDGAARGLTNFANPKEGKDDEKDAKKASDDAERLAKEQQQLDEATARARIALDDTVFRNQMDLVRRRYDYEQERIIQQREIWAGTFEGIRNESARAAVALVNRLDELRRRLTESDLAVKQAQQAVTSAARYEAVTSQGMSGGAATPLGAMVARTGNTGQSTGAHLDLRWGDGRPITKADADKYFLVNGRAPSSFGVTSPYGPRSLFGRSFHAGIDFGTPAGAALSLKGGATFSRDLGNTGAGGYAIEVMTPEGTMKALHLMANSAVRSTGGSPGGPAQMRRDVGAEGNVATAQADLRQAQTILGMDQKQIPMLAQGEGIRYAQERTQGLRDQAKALEDNNKLLLKRAELEAMGMRPELIEAQLKIAEIEQQRAAKIEQINENIAKFQNDPEAVAAFRAELEGVNSAYDRQIEAVNALAQAQTAAGAAIAARVGQLRQELEQLRGLENLAVNMSQTIETSLSTAISTAVTNFATGSGSIKQVLADLFKSVGSAFIKMAADIIAKQLVMVALNSLLGAFGGGGGGGFLSGSGALSTTKLTPGGIFATGGVMTSAGPLPLKRYASGGVAKAPQVAVFGERGPEAYVPLPDGRSIPVKMKQRDEALNRYRPIGPMGTVGPDGEAASPGGAADAAAGGAIDVRYSVERINNVEYVTAEQFQQGLRQAAAQGAQRGEQRAIRSLQQSTAVRSRVGMR